MVRKALLGGRNLLRLRRNGYSGPFFIGVTMFAMGIQLALPTDTFATSDSYTVMSDWADAAAWGVFFLGVSSFMIVQSLRRRPELVAMSSLASAFAWLVMTVSVVLGNPEGLLFPICLVMTLRCMSVFREFSLDFDNQTGARVTHFGGPLTDHHEG